MWKIGNVIINSRVVLASMSGITNVYYRQFLKSFGVGYSVTEMVNVRSIVNNNKKIATLLRMSKIDRPVAIQLFGDNIDITLKAISIIESKLAKQYDILDINLACPVKKIIRSKSGVFWMKNINNLIAYIKEIVKFSKKPVTVKLRLGFDTPIDMVDLATKLEKIGVAAIAIHARTGKQLYSGNANFEAIKDLGKKITVPLVVSGDIFTLSDAIKAVKITSATAVMVARGGLGNPFLIKQINNFFNKNAKLKLPTLYDQILYCQKLFDFFIKHEEQKKVIFLIKRIAPYFFKNFCNASNVRSFLTQRINTIDEFKNFLIFMKKGVKNGEY
ncbi:MAG: tRNA-dihydrouridine synthase family protein [Bacilli bacterium]|nr:tRNA-dihydrouridine synthase family protein [Bacilli bacterium]